MFWQTLESPRTRWTLVVIAIIVTLPFLGTRGLFETTEGRYAECAREMLETGNWLEPQLDYHPHWTKPPLTYWVLAGSMKLLGQNNWALRLPIALAFGLLVWGVYRLGTLLWDRKTGMLAAIMYATSPFSTVGSYSINTDTLLSLWELLMVLAYWQAQRAELPRRQTGWMLAMWAFTGLAFMTKGPPALLSLLCIIIFHCYQKKRRPIPLALNTLSGLAVFFVIGLSWYLVVILKHQYLLKYFLGHEVVGRIFTAEHHRHPEWYAPFTVYLPIVVGGLGVWVVFWPWIGYRYRQVLSRQAFIGFLRTHEQAAFLLLWGLLPIVLLSLAQSRLHLYLLPFFPAWALLTARGVCNILPEKEVIRRCLPPALVAAILIMAVKGIVAYSPIKKNSQRLYRALPPSSATREVMLYDHQEMYGLQFYLDGKLRRITREGSQPWAQGDLISTVKDIRRQPSPHPYVLLAKKKPCYEQIKQALIQEGLAFTSKTHDEDWFIITVNPAQEMK